MPGLLLHRQHTTQWAINAVLATPITASENTQAFATITTNGAAMLGAVQAKDNNLITWRWSASTPNAGEIFWAQPNEVTGTAGYAPSVFTAWKATYPLANRPSYLILRTDGEWMDASFTTVRCAVCQKEACSTACYPAGTATPTGTWWPSCTCTCKPGWQGVACNRQIEVYPAPVSTSVDLVSFCAGKGGFLAQPKSRAEEDAILRVVTAAVAGGTNYVKLVTIGAYDTVADGTYCYHDGPRNGECISTTATTVVGQYSDFNGAVPTGGGRIQIALDTFEKASDRWTAIKPQDTDQVACQFIDCGQVCDPTRTQQALGVYPSCTCQCKSGWRGYLCTNTATPTMSPIIASITHSTSLTQPSSTSTAQLSTTVTESANPPPTISRQLTATTDAVATPTTTLLPLEVLPSPTRTATHYLHEVDYSNDTTIRSCPAITMVLYRASGNATIPPVQIPSHTIDDTDVREGRLVVNVSLSDGPGGRFAFRTATPGTITFTVESTGVQDPRSFPAVVNTANVVCAFSPPTSRRFIICTFPLSPDYTLRVSETLVVRGGGAIGLSPPCTDAVWRLGSIRVEPTKKNVLQQVFQVAAAVATGVATAVVMLLADGTPIEIQVMIVLLNSLCASDVDRESVVLVRYFLSPAIHLGWWWVVVVNVCVAVGFALLHTGLVAVVYALRIRQAKKEVTRTSGKKKNRLSAQTKFEISHGVSAMLLYPGLPLVICHVFYIGVACGTFDVLRTKEGSEAAISALGIPFLIAVPIIDTYLLSRMVTVAYVPYEALGCVPTTGCLAWLYPKGVWGPTAEVKRFFGLIGPYRDGYRYGTLIPLAIALLAALAMNALVDVVPCDYLFVVEAIVLCLLGLVFALIRPTRANAQSLLTALCLMCVGLLAVMQIIAIRANSPSIEAAKTALNYMVVFMVIVRSAHNIFVFYIEWKWAREVSVVASTVHRNDGECGIYHPTTKFQDMLDQHAVNDIQDAALNIIITNTYDYNVSTTTDDSFNTSATNTTVTDCHPATSTTTHQHQQQQGTGVILIHPSSRDQQHHLSSSSSSAPPISTIHIETMKNHNTTNPYDDIVPVGGGQQCHHELCEDTTYYSSNSSSVHSVAGADVVTATTPSNPNPNGEAHHHHHVDEPSPPHSFNIGCQSLLSGGGGVGNDFLGGSSSGGGGGGGLRSPMHSNNNSRHHYQADIYTRHDISNEGFDDVMMCNSNMNSPAQNQFQLQQLSSPRAASYVSYTDVLPLSPGNGSLSLSGGRLGGGGVEVGSSSIFNPPPPHTTTRQSSLVSGAEAEAPDSDSMIHGDMGGGVRSSFGMEDGGGGGGHGGGGSLFSAIIRSPNTPALSPRATASSHHSQHIFGQLKHNHVSQGTPQDGGICQQQHRPTSQNFSSSSLSNSPRHHQQPHHHVLLAISSNNVFTPDSTVCESCTSPGDHQQAVVFPPQHLLPQPIFNNTTTRQGVNMPYTTRGLDWDVHNDSGENNENNDMAHTENTSFPIENGDAVFTTPPSNVAVSTSLLGSSLLAHITTDAANQQQKQRHRDSLSMTFGSSSAL